MAKNVFVLFISVYVRAHTNTCGRPRNSSCSRRSSAYSYSLINMYFLINSSSSPRAHMQSCFYSYYYYYYNIVVNLINNEPSISLTCNQLLCFFFYSIFVVFLSKLIKNKLANCCFPIPARF